MKRSVIIVAGGSGSRMKSDVPKQFLLLKGRPVLFYTLEAFHGYDPNIQLILVLPKDQVAYWQQLVEEFNFTISAKVVVGGETRYHSVNNGLDAIETIAPDHFVAIHDGVRCLVSTEVIANAFTLAQQKGNATVAVPPKDSLRHVVDGKNKAVVREDYMLIQTPQVFDLTKIKQAFALGYQPSFTDDASVFEYAGNEIFLSEGDYKNIKITTPEDLAIAELFLDKA